MTLLWNFDPPTPESPLMGVVKTIILIAIAFAAGYLWGRNRKES